MSNRLSYCLMFLVLAGSLAAQTPEKGRIEGKIVDGRLAGRVNGGGARLQVRASGGSVRLEPAPGR